MIGAGTRWQYRLEGKVHRQWLPEPRWRLNDAAFGTLSEGADPKCVADAMTPEIATKIPQVTRQILAYGPDHATFIANKCLYRPNAAIMYTYSGDRVARGNRRPE